jgi:exodeoxyribonuclease-3
MRIATWNVNSVRTREGHVRRFLERAQPDLLLMQEIKCEVSQFPALAFETLGYRAAIVGQKSYNGVAILSRVPFVVSCERLDGLEEAVPQARYIEVRAGGIRVGNLYLPNGNSGGADGYEAKLRWMDRLTERAEMLLADDEPLVLAGDYNVCPEDVDFAPGTLPANDALVRPETRARFRTLMYAGMTDALRALKPSGPAYTFWDYQAGCWPRDRGLRIDHALLSAELAERLVSCTVDRAPRAEEQPSDHTPLVIELAAA